MLLTILVEGDGRLREGSRIRWDASPHLLGQQAGVLGLRVLWVGGVLRIIRIRVVGGCTVVGVGEGQLVITDGQLVTIGGRCLLRRVHELRSIRRVLEQVLPLGFLGAVAGRGQLLGCPMLLTILIQGDGRLGHFVCRCPVRDVLPHLLGGEYNWFFTSKTIVGIGHREAVRGVTCDCYRVAVGYF